MLIQFYICDKFGWLLEWNIMFQYFIGFFDIYMYIFVFYLFKYYVILFI